MSAEPSTSELAGVLSRETKRRIRSPIFLAAPRDHAAIAALIGDALPEVSLPLFQALLEDPSYHPRNRLLLRRGASIIAHALLTERSMQFGDLQLPVGGLHHLCVAAEERHQGLGMHLLLAAEREMAVRGAVIGLLRTAHPLFFRQTGWALCGWHDYSRADARLLLASLNAPPVEEDHSLEQFLAPHARRPLHIRPWRQWELGAIQRIYRQNLPGARGPMVRSDPYWQWLTRRNPSDEILVALDGPEQLDLTERTTRIVGYAVTRGDRVLELMVAPDYPRASTALLARACADAIEQDRAAVLLHAPPFDPLHARFLEAGGQSQHSEADHGKVYMAKLLDPLTLLRKMAGEFHQRANLADLARPLDLGLLVEGRKYQLEFRSDGLEVSEQHVGRSYLRMNVADFTRLLLGQLDWDAAVASNRIEASSAIARAAGKAIFPPLPFWRPPFEALT